MVKRCILVLVLATLSVLPGRNLYSAPQTADENGKHCLWRIKGKTNAVYLLGSIHFLNEKFYPLPAPIERAYRKSGMVVFEADFDEMKSFKVQMKMVQMGKCPDGETLKDQVSKETYAKLESYLKEMSLPAAIFDPLKPWMTAVGLLGIELQKLGFNPEHGVDQHFFTAAKKDRKEIVALETVEFQLNLFNEFSKADQEAMLKQTLQEISSYKKIMEEMTTAWKTGDEQKLDALMLESMRDFPQIMKKLLVDRNVQWVKKLDEMLQGGEDVFVVVGAAHLVGKESVVDLFRRKGYTVEQQ